MRAVFINETQDFQRGVHPKQALDIGGISLGVKKYELRKKLREEWKSFLSKALDGKTISARMNKITQDGVKTGEDNWDNYIVTVDRYETPEIHDLGLIISGKDGEDYILPIDEKKIYIQDAS
jgi:hypothetical protein